MSDLQAKNILVTGGAGFIGSNFIHYLLAKHHTINIINLDLLTYAGSLDNLHNLPDPDRHHFIQGDICDQDLVQQTLRKYTIDTIVHFAAESHVDRSITGPGQFIQTNIVGTFNLLEAARSYWIDENKLDHTQCRFHHISTDEVYGTLNNSDPAFTETTAYQPNSPYSASKASSDHLVRAYCETYKLPVTLSNCSNNYGPRQHPEKLIPKTILACMQGESIPVYGNGENIRDWLYVEEHCIAIEMILRQGKIGETYNIGGNNELRNIDLVTHICKLMDELEPNNAPHAQLIQFVSDRPGHDWRYAINNSKISAELGWQPQQKLESGLLQTIRSYASSMALPL